MERAQVDVDAIDVPTYNYSDGAALHILAQPSNWWQAQTLAYLVDHGANLNAQDSNKYTPLRITIDSWGHKSAEILLRGSAAPTMIGEDSLSCLNKAGSQPEIMRLLLSYGASTISGKEPFIFEAIDAMDIDITPSMVQAGADCNILLVLDKEDKHTRHLPSSRSTHRSSAADIFLPYPFTASKRYNTNASGAKMIPVINYLLQSGADIFKSINKTTSIIHELFDRDGIIEPFRRIPGLDLEVQDFEGRTLLLAACSL